MKSLMFIMEGALVLTGGCMYFSVLTRINTAGILVQTIHVLNAYNSCLMSE